MFLLWNWTGRGAELLLGSIAYPIQNTSMPSEKVSKARISKYVAARLHGINIYIVGPVSGQGNIYGPCVKIKYLWHV